MIDNRNSEEDEKKSEKAVFNFTASDGTPYYFGIYTGLMKFAQNIYTKKLSFDEVEKEQNAMLIKLKN